MVLYTHPEIFENLFEEKVQHIIVEMKVEIDNWKNIHSRAMVL